MKETGLMEGENLLPTSPRGSEEDGRSNMADQTDDEVVFKGALSDENRAQLSLLQSLADELKEIGHRPQTNLLPGPDREIPPPGLSVRPKDPPRGPKEEEDYEFHNTSRWAHTREETEIVPNLEIQRMLGELQTAVRTQAAHIEELHGTLGGLGNDVSGFSSNFMTKIHVIQDGFAHVMQNNAVTMQGFSDRISHVEDSMERLFKEMEEIRNLIASVSRNQSMAANASTTDDITGGDGTETLSPSLLPQRHDSCSGDMFNQGNSPTTPAGILLPPGGSGQRMGTLPSLPSSGFRRLRYDDDFHSTA